MVKPISEDLRSRVIAAVEAGLSRRAAADRFGVAVASAVRWVREWRESGTARAEPQGGDKRSQRIEAYRDVILTAIESQVDITLVELAEMLRAEHGAQFAPSTIWRFLDRHSMTLKKKAHAIEQDRPDVLARRRAWFKGQLDLDPERLVFIDETGASTKMARLRGRAKRGTRCRSPIPHGHWKTTTFTGALRMTGLTAPMVLDGPMTREWFAAYAQQVLAPTLRPGDIVILDNLPAQKVGEASISIQQSQRSLDYPAAGKHLEALRGVRSFDDFDGRIADPAQSISEFVTSIATIREYVAQPKEASDDFGGHQRRAVAVLNIGGMQYGMDEIAIGVGQDVPLAPFDFLAGLIGARTAAFRGFHALTIHHASAGRSLTTVCFACCHQQGVVDRQPQPIVAPEVEPVPHSRDRRKAWWQHPPGQAAAKQIQDSLDNAPQRPFARSPNMRRGRQQRLQNRPLGIGHIAPLRA